MQRSSVIATGLAVLLASSTASLAQQGADFYRGKVVNLIVSSSAGGGYDLLARTVARYLPKHVPGAPTVVVRNMPGAGGIVATNYLVNVAPKDGLTIGSVQNNTPFEPLLGTKEADYDPKKINWLGSPSYETGLLIVWHTLAANTVADLRQKPATVAISGANSTPAFYARLLNELLGLKLKTVLGYPGQTESFMAMERGEVDGYPSIFWSSLSATKPDWVRDRKIKFIVQYGPENEIEVGATPNVKDFLKNDEDRLLLQAAIAPLALGRPYLMPPGVADDRVKIMRTALIETFSDPDFLQEADRLKLGVNVPRTAEQTEKIVSDAYATPVAVVERLRRIANGDGSGK
jgi:hypothetical protein